MKIIQIRFSTFKRYDDLETIARIIDDLNEYENIIELYNKEQTDEYIILI